MTRHVFFKGTMASLHPPGIVLMVTFFTFGTFLASYDYPLIVGVGLTLTTFAVPSQIILIDELSRGTSIVAATIAASLTAVRLLPMTMSLLPLLRGKDTPQWQLYALSHFNSATIWLQSLETLPKMPRAERATFYLGLCIALSLLTTLTTIAGFYAAHLLPPTLLAAALLITPVYFFLSLFGTARVMADRLAFLFGTLLTFPLMAYAPEFALVGAGVAGGTVAYAIGRYNNTRPQNAGEQAKGPGE